MSADQGPIDASRPWEQWRKGVLAKKSLKGNWPADRRGRPKYPLWAEVIRDLSLGEG